jgi:hypothetical protein
LFWKLIEVLENNNQHSVSILDKLEVEQKRKSKDNVNSLLKRLSLNRIQPEFDTDLLNQSIPDHFELMKNQDSINEKRPSLISSLGIKPVIEANKQDETVEDDTKRILNNN